MAITLDGKDHKIDLPLVGEFQAFNVVTALGLALATGVPQQAGLSALKSLTGVSGRMELAGHAPSGAPTLLTLHIVKLALKRCCGLFGRTRMVIL